MNNLIKTLICLAASVIFICPALFEGRGEKKEYTVVEDTMITSKDGDTVITVCANEIDGEEPEILRSAKIDEEEYFWMRYPAEQDGDPDEIDSNADEPVYINETYNEDTEAYTEPYQEPEEYIGPYSDDDLYVLAHLICGEAMDCSWDMQIAVGSVVLNRVSHYAFPNSVYGVVFEDGQYACTWDGNYYRTPTDTNWAAAEYLLTYGSQMPWYVIFQANQVVGDSYYTTIGNIVFSYNSWDLY